MGGLAVVIDRARSPQLADVDRMVALVPHRSAAGIARATSGHAALAETYARDSLGAAPIVASLGPLWIVGDLRLWNRDGLRVRAGGTAASVGMDDRRLLLEAYRQTGIEFLDDVDGDFAFVIWDGANERVIAVRDRFGAKPLFYEITPTGIRFASEPKQLATTSARSVRPNTRSVVEYLNDEYRETRFSFFEGIYRVRPAMALIADPTHRSEVRYWNPGPEDPAMTTNDDAAAGFRERLAEAVRQRIATSDATVSHLTGGLDSPSIAAAAHVLDDRGRLPSRFSTVSAVFPGYAADDSQWIDSIAATQPFSHHNIEPEVDGIEAFDRDMWEADQPRVHRIRGMWIATASIARSLGADLVLTGSGGDQVLDQDQLVIDRLMNGSASQRLGDLGFMLSTSPRSLSRVLAGGIRDALPIRVRQALRRFVPRRHPIHNPLVRHGLLNSLASESVESTPTEFGFPTRSQDYVIAFAQHPTISWFNEIREAEYASRGLDVSYPFLDRGVVEYIASIPVRGRPLDGRTKTLVRRGFVGVLPDAVLDRRNKTIADDYLDRLFVIHGAQYRERYPTVSDRALEFLSADRYVKMMASSRSMSASYSVRESLWNAWTVMAWLDGFDRYM